MRSTFLVLSLCGALVAVGPNGVSRLRAHDHTRHQADQQRRASLQLAARQAEPPPNATRANCQLTVRLREADGGRPLPGLLRITNLATQKALTLAAEIHREANWYSVPAQLTIPVPRARLRLDAFHGIETERATLELDLTDRERHEVELTLPRFYEPRARQWWAGNTHLHLMKLSYVEAIRYLELVPRTDGLDVVFLSHLRRIPDERDYISNQIVENSFTGGELQRLSQGGVTFGNGEEHRHNFGRGSEGYGHVMLLDLPHLIQPVSIGPGIMGSGDDGRPLQTGIREARAAGATVIWCHNTFGLEDIPNWMAGLLQAQNIFDGGVHGSYHDTFYRYLNLGMRIPFSTGTDWFIYDFSRVYVPLPSKPTVADWLRELQAGRTFITNGTFLELSVDGRSAGDTIALAQPATLQVEARGIGRNDFRGLELIHNGEIVQRQSSRGIAGHFESQAKWELPVGEPGWVALRIPLEAGRNEFDKPLFAHTSAVYVEVAGRKIFRREVAQDLVREMESSLAPIRSQGQFRDDSQREGVLQVYREGISRLRQRLEAP
ncbi:MAG: CehA/McbA family metallohydrolase [Pirellulaceae bacterium]